MRYQTTILRTSADATQKSAEAAEKAAKATEESLLLTHRPKLIVRNVVIATLEILNRTTSMEDLSAVAELGTPDGFQGYFQLANIGGTDAIIERIQQNIVIGYRLPMERQYTDNSTSQLRFTAGESRRIEFTRFVLPLETQVAIMNVETGVYVIGLITYRDGLGIRRETAFCRRLDRNLQRLVPTKDEDYDYAD